MARLNSSASVYRFGVLAALLAMVAPGRPAWADPILEIHDGSLTTYLPSSKSNIQDIRALVDQRGVNIDGSLRLRSTQRMAMGGNPFREAWNRNQMLSGARLDTGTFVINDVDLTFPGDVPWLIGRSYNTRQKDSGGSYFASNGYQGKNWFQSSQPELVFHDSATDSEDTIYLVYGADRFLEFRRADDAGQGDSTDTFKAVNGAAGAILLHTFDDVDLATYYDQNGNRVDFFWFGDADIDDDIEGSIWRMMDPTVEVDPYDPADRLVAGDGNTAYVGDIGNPNTALSSGYNATTGAVTTAYDSTGRRFTYTYTSGKLTQVKAEVNSGGWTEVGKVDYSYYVAADAHGEDDDLELVTITLPLTDSGVSSIRKKYYWYYEGTYDATNNPGYHHQIQYVIDFEGYRGYDWDQDSNLDDDPQSATEANLKSYASSFFKYDTDRRIVSAWFNGACGCSGAASGTHTFTYESNGSYTDNTGYDTTWKSRTIAKKPDVKHKTADPAIESYITQYFDEVGQPLSRVSTKLTPTDTSGNQKTWATKVTRNADAQVTDIHSPANVTGYTHSTASFTTSTSAGLVTVFTRVPSGDMKGFVADRKHKKGTSGSAYLDGTSTYTSRSLTVSDVGLTRPLIASRRVYTKEIISGTDDSRLTSLAYTFHSATSTAVLYIAPKKITTTNPAVSTANNGSNSSTKPKRYLRKDGTTAFSESATNIFTYTQYTDGQLSKRIDDVKTNGTFPTGDDPNTDFGITETADGWDRSTTYAYDAQGRSDIVTQPDGRVGKRYYSKLADSRLVTLGYNDYEDLATDKFHGPVQYTVRNHARRTEVRATVSLTGNESTTALTGHIDETDSDPITAMDLGTVARMTVSVFDETGGVLEESRPYFLIPASGSGTDGTNYDATFIGYDDQGRRMRTKAPHGTISRSDFDTLGRVVRQWIGTNDNDFDGGETGGTDNMVKTSAKEYDSGNDKDNSSVTKRTAFIQDSETGKREPSYSFDLRGRVLLTTNPTEPEHVLNKYDNMGRVIASGVYKNGNVAATDDPTTRTTDRLSLTQTFYDEMGRVWKTQRHKIDDADGSDDDNLQTLTWYDAAGRVIKVDGSQLTKTSYDRLGRRTHRFTLASDNDTGYSDADDVTGDIVLQETQTVYESSDSGDVVMTATIDRFHDDYGAGETTGALDTNADFVDVKYTAANLEGRIQITANWYDRFGRRTDTVRYGTNGGSDFNRSGLSVPTRSDTKLLTEQVYNTDGTLKSTTDPENLETRFEYDDAGRQTKVISNYTDGTPSADTDQTIKYEYTDGLRTKMTADLPASETDQVTTYTYAVTTTDTPGASKIAAKHLLREVKYPDSADSNDVVRFAYNAQSQQIWTKDQEGNVIETDYDDAGRQTHRRITTLDADFDGAVRRISTTYDKLGRRDLVTQYDNATVGSGTVVDEVKFTYEDWGNVEKFEQDHNSAIGGSLLYDIDYTYAKATNGRNTIRRSGFTLPDGNVITYQFRSNDLHDEEASRVTNIKDGAVTLVIYDYNGVGQVVGTDYPEPDVMWDQFGSSGSYPDLDRFNRVTSSRWTKDLATDVDFYDLDITYDRDSNITLIEDNVHAGFDVDYDLDNLNRLTQAQEGTWNSGTSQIDSTTRDQIWTTLSQTGNWELVKLDLNGDGDFIDTDEYNDDRTHNDVNELTARDTDDDGTNDFTLTSDKLGNLTDDGEHWEYVYDPFGRLRQVKKTSDQALVVEYTYSGLGHRIGWHYDVDGNGTVDDISDPWFRFVYDERWRIVATYRDSDSSPKEQFVYHNAGLNGFGGSSYIDTVVLRDKDANTAWSAASDGTLEERIYYCHNWRGDVSVLITDTGNEMVEWVKYSSYGVPFGLPKGDTDSDGDLDTTDYAQIGTWIQAAQYDVRGDLDLDGDVDTTDRTMANNALPITLGWGVLSDLGNRKGYAGYELDDAIAGAYRLYHVRNRVLNADLGRWLRRDPLGYVDGANLYPYVRSNPMTWVDPNGTNILCDIACHAICGLGCLALTGPAAFLCHIACFFWCFAICNPTPIGPALIPFPDPPPKPDPVKACIARAQESYDGELAWCDQEWGPDLNPMAYCFDESCRSWNHTVCRDNAQERFWCAKCECDPPPAGCGSSGAGLCPPRRYAYADCCADSSPKFEPDLRGSGPLGTPGGDGSLPCPG
ncbi:MAG: RHS repeat-associated core domain-containing protein [Planctomycetes bacterium]|nr:RHS repeat-associated core domain-containing protein [Planctomycetota bacterium]